MAKSITLVKVFIASPSDTNNERMSAERIVKEINLMNGETQNFRIELLKWETHALPSISEYSQQIINKEIGHDYDIFIGVMWKKFGTRTKVADSGTQEEFNIAFQRYKEKKDVNIMFYFNNAPVPVNDINPEQITKIKFFKNELGEKGGLYWEYNDISEFENFLRIHLAKAVNEILKSDKLVTELVKTEIKDVKQENDFFEDDLGMFELIDMSESTFNGLQEIAIRMTSIVEDLGNKLSKRTDEITDLANVNPIVDPKDAQRLVNKAAEDLMDFENRLRLEIPIFKEKYSKGFEYYSRALSINSELDGNQIALKEALIQVKELKDSLEFADSSMANFQKIILGLPGLTTKFNIAKRKTVNVLRDLRSEFKLSINTIDEFETQTLVKITN